MRCIFMLRHVAEIWPASAKTISSNDDRLLAQCSTRGQVVPPGKAGQPRISALNTLRVRIGLPLLRMNSRLTARLTRPMRDFDAISRRYSLDRRECGGVISIWAIGSTLNLLLSAKRIGWLLRLPEAMKPSAECEGWLTCFARKRLRLKMPSGRLNTNIW